MGTRDGQPEAGSADRDTELVERAQRGDKAAFEELFRQYRERVYVVVYGYVRDQQDALDITQDAFLKAYRKLRSFKGNARFSTWITQIAINLAIDLCRKRKRRPTVTFDQYTPDGQRLGAAQPPPAPHRGALEHELQERYAEALRQLSEKHRTVFVLHVVEGLPYKDIAETLGISIGTVMSRLHYARKHLQGLLGEYLKGR